MTNRVVKLQEHEYDPVTIFKPQGQECATNTSLAKNDFLLGIQTMKAFGDKLDATHGTNHYDFKLVTVLVLDDFGEGIPVGCNKEDGTVLKAFLRSLLDQLTRYFMMDDAE